MVDPQLADDNLKRSSFESLEQPMSTARSAYESNERPIAD